jgi:hypothetical protein
MFRKGFKASAFCFTARACSWLMDNYSQNILLLRIVAKGTTIRKNGILQIVVYDVFLGPVPTVRRAESPSCCVPLTQVKTFAPADAGAYCAESVTAVFPLNCTAQQANPACRAYTPPAQRARRGRPVEAVRGSSEPQSSASFMVTSKALDERPPERRIMPRLSRLRVEIFLSCFSTKKYYPALIAEFWPERHLTVVVSHAFRLTTAVTIVCL